MDRQVVTDRLLELPGEIETAETDVFNAQLIFMEAKDDYAYKEAALYLEGKIDGKNAEVRAAQLKDFTTLERHAVTTADNQVVLARIKLNRLINEFKAYRAIAGMLEQMG